MKNPIAGFVILLLCFATACHRPYALYQRTTPQTFHSPRPIASPPPVDSMNWAALVPEETPETTEPIAYASARPGMPAMGPQHRDMRPQHRVISPAKATTEPAQPKPKPRTQPAPQRKTLREVLGLKPRPKLNWWQRISWKLKASVIVILVAVVFALLQITTLAILFGLIGAFLLVTGLKKSFKVRRPWF